ncbi:MAG: Rne/Rng family ribonuclease [Acidimicrobiales bacterium]
MLDPTTGRPASVPNAPRGAAGAPEVASGAQNEEPPGSFASGASAATVPQRPKIGDSRPAPPFSKPAEPVAVPEGDGRRAQPGQQGELQGGENGDGAAAGTGQGGGSSRRRRGGRSRSRRANNSAGSRASTYANGTAPDGLGADAGAGSKPAGASRAPRNKAGANAQPRRAPVSQAAASPGTDAGPAQRLARDRRGRPVGRYLMCVHVEHEATHIAVLEGRALIEHFVARPQDDANQIVGNIYRGRVKNVLPGMEAAFVDIGTPKNAVLYWGDVSYDRDDVERQAGADRIEHLLRPGQTIVCQVTKNPIGLKGARLTQEVSIPGRFVVLVPESATYGISRRLDDTERRRLRRILDDVRPDGHGLIVRTAAAGASAEDLRRDVEMLVGRWREIDERTRKLPAPALLYSEPHMAVRIIREELTDEHRSVLIDDPELFVIVRDYVSQFNPELAERVELYDLSNEPLPLFERHHVHEQLHKALDRKVWLPSGGSLIIERTEALTVIDVNTGKNVGSSSLEETVFENNLEAAEEIARQLRLRDIGGIIVIDFVDMEIKANRTSVLAAFKAALARDKTPTQVYEISELGLVEMTRKRVGEGLVEALSETCPTCAGRGIIFPDQDL